MKAIATGTLFLSILLAAFSASGQLLNPSQRPSQLLPYTQCKFNGGLAPLSVERAPDLPMARPVETPSGTKRVSVVDGYRVMLAFPNTDPFVNLKIEVSVPGQYAADKKVVLEQMDGMAASARGVKMSVERSSVDGVEIAALNNPSLAGSGISLYSLFDARRDMIVTAYILNQKADRRAFQDMDEYRKLRDAFIRDLTACMARSRGIQAGTK
jgi:hypothetical protein